jgi:hypothetical protein
VRAEGADEVEDEAGRGGGAERRYSQAPARIVVRMLGRVRSKYDARDSRKVTGGA